MKWTLPIFVLLIAGQQKTTLLTGKVSMDDHSWSGCQISVVGNDLKTVTDSDGKFSISINDIEKISLLFSYQDNLTCKVLIEDITVDQKNVDLGAIPLFLNQTISVEEYHALNLSQKREYEPLRHWTQLIGYISKNRTDTVVLRRTLKTEMGIKYRLDSLSNTVVISYEDWIK